MNDIYKNNGQNTRHKKETNDILKKNLRKYFFMQSN